MKQLAAEIEDCIGDQTQTKLIDGCWRSLGQLGLALLAALLPVAAA